MINNKIVLGYIGNGKSTNRYHLPFVMQRPDKFIVKTIYNPRIHHDVWDKIEGVNYTENQDDIFLDDVIKIGQQEFESNQREISLKKVKLGVSDEIIKYKFITPWLALNQNNIKKYTAADLIEKEEILKRVLIGNILSFSKGMDYTVDETIKVKLDLNQIDVKFKQKEMLAFIGEFFINFEIPDNFAIGKGISRGFGTVKKI